MEIDFKTMVFLSLIEYYRQRATGEVCYCYNLYFEVILDLFYAALIFVGLQMWATTFNTLINSELKICTCPFGQVKFDFHEFSLAQKQNLLAPGKRASASVDHCLYYEL